MSVIVADDRGCIGTALDPFPRAAGHQVDGLGLNRNEGATSARRTQAYVARAISGTLGPVSWPATT